MPERVEANSRLEMMLFGGVPEDPEKMFERDSFSRAGDSSRWPVAPLNLQGATAERAPRRIGVVELDPTTRTTTYTRLEGTEAE